MSSIPVNLKEQITEIEKRDITYRTLHIPAVMKNKMTGEVIEIPFSSLLRKYKDFLSTIIVTADLNEELETKYRYKPKMLSKDLYGTTELWDELLCINGCASVIEFIPKKVVRVYDTNRIKSFINEILILENVI